MYKPSVSVIVPVYNVEPYVAACVRSVMRQTYEGKIECIFVDDCGTDNSIEVVKKLIAEYSGPIVFKILYATHNQGPSVARNIGMDAATCEYLYFMDGDDEITDDCIETLTAPLVEELYDIVVGDIKVIDGEKPSGWMRLKLEDGTILRSPDIMKNYRQRWNMTATNKLYRSQFVHEGKLNFKEGIHFEDELWGFQTACVAKSLFASKRVTYSIRVREGSRSVTSYCNKNSVSRAYIIILIEMFSFVKNRMLFNYETYQFLQFFFYEALSKFMNSFLLYEKTYKELRQYVKPSIKLLLLGNRFRLKSYLRDFHYYLPGFIAPYWQYMFIYCRWRVISKLRRRVYKRHYNI